MTIQFASDRCISFVRSIVITPYGIDKVPANPASIVRYRDTQTLGGNCCRLHLRAQSDLLEGTSKRTASLAMRNGVEAVNPEC
jgi:hypothetical protein